MVVGSCYEALELCRLEMTISKAVKSRHKVTETKTHLRMGGYRPSKIRASNER